MTTARGVSLAIAVALIATGAAAQQDFSKVEITTTRLNETTYVMTGAGGNLALSIGEDAVFLIDDQYAALTDRINAAIAKITPKAVRFVVNTHWHSDHVGGNETLGKAGAIVFAHENVRRRMSSEQFIEFMRSTVPPSSAGALPVVTFPGSLTFHLNAEEIRVIHMPRAHTDGDAIVHFTRGDIVHMGDIYWNGMYPFIDTSSGGTVDGVIAACDQVLKMSTGRTQIIAGHGRAVTGVAELKAYRDMLATVTGRIRKMIDEGRSLEDITASKVSAEFDEKWGKSFIPPAKFAQMLAMNILKNR